jgi:hypothetical protein
MCTVKITAPYNSTLSLNSELKISMFGAQDPLYDSVCYMNRQLHSSHINTNCDSPYRIVWKYEEFQIRIAAASSASRHVAVLFSVYYGPSQIHYSLKPVFPINRTTAS